MSLFLDDGDVRLYHGDALETLRGLPDGSVDCCVTSPPYWGLRDYGTGEWEGGDPDCGHAKANARQPHERKSSTLGGGTDTIRVQEEANVYRDVCGKCGARRLDRQIGLEATPDAYVAGMVAVFREVRRVLADHGTCWVNLGDSYNANTGRGFDTNQDGDRNGKKAGAALGQRMAWGKPKDLVGIPWAVAKALQEPYYTGRIARERDRVWLAATIDAEGSLCGFTHERSDGDGTRTGIHITITNTSMPMLAEAQRIWPTSRDDGNGHGVSALGTRECRRWIAHGVDDKAALLAELYPYLIAKPKQALLAWNFLRMSSDAKRIGKMAEGTKAKERRTWIVGALSDLNHGRGVDVPSWVEEPPSLYEPGWYLRSDIIWSKPNPMPESVTDRPTKAHEYVFLLTKAPRYWFDAEAVREPMHPSSVERLRSGWNAESPRDGMVASHILNRDGAYEPNPAGRNVRSVWQIATQPYRDAHFATFPEELARRCILAGCPARVCQECGRPSERIGWTDCGHGAYRPGVTLDPFAGSGTTLKVARDHGRHAVGIDLNRDYLELAARRLQQLSLLSEIA